MGVGVIGLIGQVKTLKLGRDLSKALEPLSNHCGAPWPKLRASAQVDSRESGRGAVVLETLGWEATHIRNEGRVQHPSLQALEVHVPEEGVPLDLGCALLLAAQPLLCIFGEQL